MDYTTRQRLNEAEKSIKRLDQDVFKMGRMIADHDTTIGKLVACADDVPHLASDKLRAVPAWTPKAGILAYYKGKYVKGEIVKLTGHRGDGGFYFVQQPFTSSLAYSDDNQYFRPLRDEDWVVEVGGMKVSAKWLDNDYLEVSFNGFHYGYGKTAMPAMKELLRASGVPIKPLGV
jgi:hypothetical protein